MIFWMHVNKASHINHRRNILPPWAKCLSYAYVCQLKLIMCWLMKWCAVGPWYPWARHPRMLSLCLRGPPGGLSRPCPRDVLSREEVHSPINGPPYASELLLDATGSWGLEPEMASSCILETFWGIGRPMEWAADFLVLQNISRTELSLEGPAQL